MNKTQNYKLNQWEKSDRVLMEDFNADNAKIDAAIANKSAFTLLKRATGGGAKYLDLSTSDLDWNRYHMLFLEAALPATSRETVQIGANISWSYRVPGSNSVNSGFFLPDQHHTIDIVFFKMGGMSQWSRCVTFTDKGIFTSYSTIAMDQISHFSLSAPSGTLPEGATMALWGLR